MMTYAYAVILGLVPLYLPCPSVPLSIVTQVPRALHTHHAHALTRLRTQTQLSPSPNHRQTYSGLFLVIVNPYKRLPIYSDDIARHYRGRPREHVPPHVFTIAEEARAAMRETGRNQTILITYARG